MSAYKYIDILMFRKTGNIFIAFWFYSLLVLRFKTFRIKFLKNIIQAQ